jgi:very-short-patch-repair endonuclease
MTDLERPTRHGSPPRPGCARQGGAHRVKVLGVRRIVRVAGTKDERVAVIAGAQRGRIARRQLLAVGVTRDMIRTMVANGALHRRRPGVYAVGHVAPIELARETEALLACGDRAVLSHVSAAALWGIAPAPAPDRPVDVLVVARRTGGGRKGIRVHRSRTITRKDIRIHNGLPVTSPARTLLDNADEWTYRELEIALDEALATKIMRRSEMLELLARTEGRRGATLLRALMAQRVRGGTVLSTVTKSMANERLFRMIRAARLPEPELDVKIGVYEADFYWREAGVAIEVDGYQWHSERRARERDRRKTTAFEDAGILLNRVTWEEMDEDALAIVARLARQISERSNRAARAA